MFPFCVAGGGFAMDPGVAMRRAAMMDDDMDSAGVEDKDGGSNRSMPSSCGQPICVFLLTCKVLVRLIGASQNGLRLGHIADEQQHFYAWRLAVNPANSSPK